jgi:uncharacterized membrane protein YphA (DoxX/SURF4 family)
MKKINLLDIITFAFVALFIYAASSKLLDFEAFRAQIGKSPLIMSYAGTIAWLIPSIEIVVALLFLFPRLQYIALYLSYSLMLLFTLYISFILMFSPYVPCSCGGILSSLGWKEHLVFNVTFTLLAIVGVRLKNGLERKSHALLHMATTNI